MDGAFPELLSEPTNKQSQIIFHARKASWSWMLQHQSHLKNFGNTRNNLSISFLLSDMAQTQTGKHILTSQAIHTP